jgi:hypothetical protein
MALGWQRCHRPPQVGWFVFDRGLTYVLGNQLIAVVRCTGLYAAINTAQIIPIATFFIQPPRPSVRCAPSPGGWLRSPGYPGRHAPDGQSQRRRSPSSSATHSGLGWQGVLHRACAVPGAADTPPCEARCDDTATPQPVCGMPGGALPLGSPRPRMTCV